MILEYIKKHYISLLTIFGYTVIAFVVYTVWFDSLWHSILIDVFTGIVIVAIGVLIGFLWLRALDKEEKKVLEETPQAEK